MKSVIPLMMYTWCIWGFVLSIALGDSSKVQIKTSSQRRYELMLRLHAKNDAESLVNDGTISPNPSIAYENRTSTKQLQKIKKKISHKIRRSRSNLYSAAWENSTQPWDNIDHVMFNDDCRACNSWVYRTTSPAETQIENTKAIAFLHMRKSGGTMFLRLLQKWFLRKGCLKPVTLKRPDDPCRSTARNGLICSYDTAFGGVHNSLYYTYKNSRFLVSQHCSGLEFRHFEYSCMHGDSIVSLPSRKLRESTPLSMFTILRHPLERLASQFFFVGPGEEFVSGQINSVCRLLCIKDKVNVSTGINRQRKRPVKSLSIECKTCTQQQTEHAANELKRNDSLWLRWIRDRQSHGFGERYMPNYYVHRLTSGTPISPGRASDRDIAIKCVFEGNRTCQGDNIDVLSNIAVAEYCSSKGRNMSEALEVAKEVLKSQFDFIILEMLSEEELSLPVIRRVFDADFAESLRPSENGTFLDSNRPQAGLFRMKLTKQSTTSGLYYREKMPPSVLKEMEIDNAYDIQLYEYAVELFRERSKHY